MEFTVNRKTALKLKKYIKALNALKEFRGITTYARDDLAREKVARLDLEVIELTDQAQQIIDRYVDQVELSPTK